MGLITDLNAALLDFFPEYTILNPYGKDRITLEHALTLSDGLEWYELQYPYGHEKNTFTEWRRQDGSLQFILDQPLVESPGTQFNYNSGMSHLLSVVLEKQTGTRLDSFTNEKLFKPLGIKDYFWQTNQDGAAKGYAGLYLRPRDLAKFGYLYLKKGKWDQEQVVPESWVAASTSPHILRGDIPGFYYGYQWWVHEEGLIAAVGYGNQILMIIPEDELVVVFTNAHSQYDWFQQETPCVCRT